MTGPHVNSPPIASHMSPTCLTVHVPWMPRNLFKPKLKEHLDESFLDEYALGRRVKPKHPSKGKGRVPGFAPLIHDWGNADRCCICVLEKERDIISPCAGAAYVVA